MPLGTPPQYATLAKALISYFRYDFVIYWQRLNAAFRWPFTPAIFLIASLGPRHYRRRYILALRIIFRLRLRF